MVAKNLVALFDESGTPGIGFDERTEWFIGVGVSYEFSDEDVIFSKAKDDFGLANSKPLKNDRIRNARAISIAKLLADCPVNIYVSSVNTADAIFENLSLNMSILVKKPDASFGKPENGL